MDLIVICYWLFLPAAFFLLLPKNILGYLKYFWIFYFTLFIDLAFFLEMATFPFLKEYDLRPDEIFIRYLDHYKEVGGTVWATNKWYLIITILLLIVVHIATWRSFRKIVTGYSSLNWKWRLLAFPIVGGLLFLGARSSFAPRPANISTAYFSEENKLVNELTLNSTYTVVLAATRLANEKDPSAIYGSMQEEEIFRRVKKNTGLPDSLYLHSGIPFLRRHFPSGKSNRPLNVVIILEESLGAEYIGYLKGLPLTPNLDSLSKQGLSFQQLYSTGTRTVRGIEAVVTGFLPTPGNSVVNLGLSRSGFFTAGELFKNAGYTTEFIYGGESNFDEMRSFFISNGFDKIYDEPSFKKPVFTGVWGVSDEDLMTKANEVFEAHGDHPFFSVILSTSNHSPFEFPDGRIALYQKPKQSVYNAMKYADYAIGQFFEKAKRSAYYKNTLFLIVADHSTRVFGDEFIPVEKFHIPGVIIGPNVPVMSITKVTSQIDLLPTLLYLSGVKANSPMIGKNAMTLSKDDPGRCFMQYGLNYGYMFGDTLMVLKPYSKPQEFLYNNKTNKLTALHSVNNERARDALAFSLLPWDLYIHKEYRLN
jgi:phosphoglycerol transferase MdoB-like AlkP superfamily enzyme